MTSSLYSLLWNSPCRDTWKAERPAGLRARPPPRPGAAQPRHPAATRDHPPARPPARLPAGVCSPKPAVGSTARAALRLPCSNAAARASQMPPRPLHMSPEPPPSPAVRPGRAAARAASAPLKRCARPQPPRAPTRDSAHPPRERCLGRAAPWPPGELHPCAASRWPLTPGYLLLLSIVCHTSQFPDPVLQDSLWCQNLHRTLRKFLQPDEVDHAGVNLCFPCKTRCFQLLPETFYGRAKLGKCMV